MWRTYRTGDEHVGRRLRRRSRRQPRGAHGARRRGLHEWMFAGRSPADSRASRTTTSGASGRLLILGRRMADVGIGPWGDEPTFHAPCSVVPIEPPRRSPRTAVRPTPSSPTASRMPWTGRGMLRGPRTCSSTAAQPLPASPQRRAADEARLHLVPVVMGAGTPLFDGVRSDVRFVPSDATSSPLTTHLTYCAECGRLG